MKIWTIKYKIKDEDGIWSRQRVVAKDYLEAIEKANKLTEKENGEVFNRLRISLVEEEEDELGAI